jgi:hypothetical protein
VNGIVSNGGYGPTFTVGTPPNVSYTNPSSGPVGTSVTVTGSYFGATQGGSTVSFNGTQATPTSWSDTSIVAPVPSGATTGAVKVTVNGIVSNGGYGPTFTVGTPPNVSYTNPASGPVGTSVTVTGSYFGATQGNSTVSFNGTQATPTSWSDTSIVAPVPSGATTGAVKVTVSGIVSNGGYGPTFTVGTPPNVSYTSPATGGIGTTVTIFGQYFGSTQGSSTVTFNGTQATPTSWSDTSIVVSVPSGATTGAVKVTVNGIVSNGGYGPTFTVGTPPGITASVSPSANSSGWNNSTVTITFTCTAGSAAIANCPNPQTVSAEGANQVVSGTATDVSGLTAPARVTINIDKTPPTLAVTSPVDGTGFSNASVTVSGAVSDALSGLSSVTCDGAAASVSAGNFSCNISLNVGVNLVVVRATDLAGNVAASNFHLSLVGTLPTPNSLQISPAGVNMLVGETRQFAAVDELGRVRSDATWTVSDSTLATITADSSPTLTAVAVGQVTLKATVQSITAQIQLNILSGATLPPGTVRWSAPLLPGLTTRQIIQAVPTVGNTPDLYTHEVDSNGSTTIRAFTADGLPVWQAGPIPINFSENVVTPDGLGGVLVAKTTSSDGVFSHATTTLTDLDAVTGSPVWTYSPVASINQKAIRADGTIFLVQATPEDSAGNVYTYLVALDGNSGTPVLNLQLPDALIQTFDCNGNLFLNYYRGGYSQSNLAIDTDGTVSLPISLLTATGTLPCINSPGSGSFTSIFALFQLKPDSSTLVTPIRTVSGDSQSGVTPPRIDAWQVIPDGQGGTLVAWDDHTTPNQPLDYVTHIPASGTNDFYFPALYGPLPSMVLGENGTAFVTDSQTIQAFNINSGALWNYVSPAFGVKIVASSAGAGVVAEEFSANNTSTVIRFNSSGAMTPDPWAGSGTIDYVSANLWTTFTSGVAMAEYAAPAVQEASAPSTRPGGDPQHNGTTDPGMVLVATQDCHKVNAQNTLFARYPIYSLRLLIDKSKTPMQNYTVFEFIPRNPAKCNLGGYSRLNPCAYADGSTLPYNEFADEISAGPVFTAFGNTQYFLYGLPKQRLFGVKQIFRTLPDGSLQPKPGWNQLVVSPGADPLIDGQPDPWLAPWNGAVASCDSSGSVYFP